MQKKPRSQRSVLCVDPRGALKPLCEKGLKRGEVRLITAADGAAALQAIEAIHPDVIVTDLGTPIYSGADLCLSVQGFGPKTIPVLLVFPDDSSDAAAVAAGCEADAFVVGDPSPAAMGALVRGLLREALLHHRLHFLEERLKRANLRNGQQPELDEVTGFLPMAVFRHILINETKRAQRYRLPLGVVLVGFDAYAPLRARHDDATLAPLFADLGQVVLKLIRDIDVPVRSSADRVMVMLPHTDSQGTRRVGERIAAQARMLRVEVKGERVSSAVSVGAAGYDGFGDVSFADLVRRARVALEAVHARGGDGVELR